MTSCWNILSNSTVNGKEKAEKKAFIIAVRTGRDHQFRRNGTRMTRTKRIYYKEKSLPVVGVPPNHYLSEAVSMTKR